jgi:hypothetical protein
MVEAGLTQFLCGEVACNCDPQKDVEWMVVRMRVDILEDNERLMQKQNDVIQKLLDGHEIQMRKAEAVHAMQLLKVEEAHAAQMEDVKKSNEKSYDRLIQTIESLLKELIGTVKTLCTDVVQEIKSFARGLSSGNVYEYNWLWCALPQMLLCALINYFANSAPFRIKVTYGWFLQCLVSSSGYYFIQLFNDAISNSSTVAWLLSAEVCLFTTLSCGVVWFICRIPATVPTSVPAQGPVTNTTTGTTTSVQSTPTPIGPVVLIGASGVKTPTVPGGPESLRDRIMRVHLSHM